MPAAILYRYVQQRYGSLNKGVLLLVISFIQIFTITYLEQPMYVGYVTYILQLQFNPYPTAFPYGNGMVLHFYQQQESSMTKTVHKVINKGLKTYV